ncbi:MAG: hypothetical protein AAF608_08545 [Pseudomonadota bacterium]
MDDRHFASLATVGVAALLLLLGIVLLLVPLNLFSGTVPTPILPLCIIFIYGLERPESLPPSLSFAMGLLHDLLFGAAIGPWASVYLVVHALVVWQRSYFAGRDVVVLTTGFAAASVLAMALYWFEMSILSSRPMPVFAIFWQWVVTVLSFPFLLALFRRLAGRPRSNSLV